MDDNEIFDVPENGRLVTRGKNPYHHLLPEEDFEMRKEAAANARVERFTDRAQEMAGGPVRAQDIGPGYADRYADEIGESMYAEDRLATLRERLIEARRNR